MSYEIKYPYIRWRKAISEDKKLMELNKNKIDEIVRNIKKIHSLDALNMYANSLKINLEALKYIWVGIGLMGILGTNNSQLQASESQIENLKEQFGDFFKNITLIQWHSYVSPALLFASTSDPEEYFEDQMERAYRLAEAFECKIKYNGDIDLFRLYTFDGHGRFIWCFIEQLLTNFPHIVGPAIEDGVRFTLGIEINLYDLSTETNDWHEEFFGSEVVVIRRNIYEDLLLFDFDEDLFNDGIYYFNFCSLYPNKPFYIPSELYSYITNEDPYYVDKKELLNMLIFFNKVHKKDIDDLETYFEMFKEFYIQEKRPVEIKEKRKSWKDLDYMEFKNGIVLIATQLVNASKNAEVSSWHKLIRDKYQYEKSNGKVSDSIAIKELKKFMKKEMEEDNLITIIKFIFELVPFFDASNSRNMRSLLKIMKAHDINEDLFISFDWWGVARFGRGIKLIKKKSTPPTMMYSIAFLNILEKYGELITSRRYFVTYRINPLNVSDEMFDEISKLFYFEGNQCARIKDVDICNKNKDCHFNEDRNICNFKNTHCNAKFKPLETFRRGGST
jgi:hypothetical protein